MDFHELNWVNLINKDVQDKYYERKYTNKINKDKNVHGFLTECI